MAGSYGHPVHPILVTLPIGGWVFSLVFDFVSYVSSEPRIWSVGAMWLVLLGVIGAALAAVWGVIDLRNIPKATAAFNTGRLHAALNSVAIVIFLVGFIWRFRTQDSWEASPVGPLVLSIVGMAVVSASGFLGGSSPITTAYAWPTNRSRPRGSGRRRPRGAETSAGSALGVLLHVLRHGVGPQRPAELGHRARSTA